MSTAEASPTRRELRRQQSRDEIVGAAWELVAEQGLAGLSLRELATRVGMKAPSLYSYFGSKHEIYDAMFREGHVEFAAAVESLDEMEIDGAAAGRQLFHRTAHVFCDFCTDDPVRYQLLFQRTIPDFVPSDESYAVATASYARMTEQFARAGVTEPEAVDLLTALLTGLTSQQLSNDPGGDRWLRLVDRAIDLLLADIAPHLIDDGSRP